MRSVEQALAYVTDCNLATVCDLASLKKPPKQEFARQISIAQQAIDWMRSYGVDFTGTRAVDVVKAGNVATWAERFRPR